MTDFWVRLENTDVAAEVVDYDPTDRFNPELVWVKVGAAPTHGDIWDGTKFDPPIVAAPAASSMKTALEFLSLFTDVQRAGLWSADPALMSGALTVILRGWVDLSSSDTASILALGVQKGVLTEAERDRILAGTPPAPASSATASPATTATSP